MRVPWTARRSNQSILREINPGYSLEGMMLKLKLQYFDHFMQRVDSLEKTLMLGGIGDRRRRGRQRMRWLDGNTDLMDVSLSELLELVLEKTLESPLDCKEIQPAHSEGDQPWVFFGRNDAKAETPVLWPAHAKC